jgi:hypothetical protein
MTKGAPANTSSGKIDAVEVHKDDRNPTRSFAIPGSMRVALRPRAGLRPKPFSFRIDDIKACSRYHGHSRRSSVTGRSDFAGQSLMDCLRLSTMDQI